MFEQLTSLVKEYAGEAVINNPAIPNDKNEEVVHMASSSILDTLKNAVSGGNISDLTNIFNGNEQAATNAGITNSAQGNFVEKLVQKLGLDPGVASKISGSLIPIVMSKLVRKTNDPNDNSFDLPGILGNLSGGKIGDVLGNLTGGSNAPDEKNSGGMLDKLKGLFN